MGRLAGKPVDGVPWVPFAGVHAGQLCGYTATELLQDADKVVAALTEANRSYQPDELPVLFDLQVEAEILGCDLLWADDTLPTVRCQPLAETKTIPSALPEKTSGRMPIAIEATMRLKESIGHETALFGLVCGPFTLASHLRGTEIFLDMMDDPNYVCDLIRYCSEVSQRVAGFYAEAGVDVLALVDPLVSQISENHFTQFLAVSLKQTFDGYRNMGLASAFFVCGDATRSIRVMCETGPDSIFVDENIDLKQAEQITDDFDISIGGNIPLSSVMLFGSQTDNMRYVVEEFESVGTDHLILAPGCDMPYDTPAENVIGVMQAARNPDEVRKMLGDITEDQTEEEMELVPVDYDTLDRPIVEVYTLDSATCPACSYMMYAVNRAREELGDTVDVVEYKAVVRENLARAKFVGIKNMPVVLINCELTFSSLIPNHNDLIASIEGKR